MGCNDTKYFTVNFSVPGTDPEVGRSFRIMLDDQPCDADYNTLRATAIGNAWTILLNSQDYKFYGNNWILKEVIDG